MFKMHNLVALKYADLRKLAKKAGIKANLKHEKLVEELTKFYGNDVARTSQESKESTSADQKTQTPDAKPKTPVSISRTPLVAKRLTPASKQLTPAAGNTSISKQYGKSTPGSASSMHRWEKRVFSPSVAARSTTSASKPATTKNKLTSPNKLSESSPLNQDVQKRKLTDTPDVQSEKKRKLEKTPTPDLSSPQVGESSTRKRRSTFEKAPTPNLKTPDIESPQRQRSGRQKAGSSQSVEDMLGAMKSEMNKEEMKQSLMSILDRNVQEKVKTAPGGSTCLPRFAAFAMKNKESKPITPGNKDWKKIHKKNFSKFDSIDVYLEKKRKRAEDMSASVKKAKTLLSEVQTAVDKLKSHKTPETNENKFVKPRVSNANQTTPFKPTVLNTSKINLNFGAKTSSKTLPRKSPKSLISSTLKRTQPVARKSTGSVVPQKSSATPFKFTAVQSSALNNTVASTKKQVFDLKASLARPITWKTHKGKLKPLENSSKSPVYAKTLSTTKAKTKTNRAATRANVAQRRADKKHDARMARRGIKM